jgi:uncharacterized protein YkwD
VAVIVTVLMLAGMAEAAGAATLTRTESSLLTAMNEARRAQGLRPLRADGRLERGKHGARGHSSEMLRTDTFFHGAFSARIRGVGVRAPRVGENLAWGVGALSRARAIVNTWLASPGHRANLLHGGYRIVGVGALRGTFGGHRGTLMITTDFAGR